MTVKKRGRPRIDPALIAALDARFDAGETPKDISAKNDAGMAYTLVYARYRTWQEMKARDGAA